ncbi:MAG: glycosyltransferase family 2 protein [Acetobacteraceae bacterium]
MHIAARRKIAVVIPVNNEAENIAALLTEIRGAMGALDYEIVCVDDGSTDATAALLTEALRDSSDLRCVRHRAACGQSAAIITGVRTAQADWIATIDGDGQNDPLDIPAMFAEAIKHDRPGIPVLIAGHRAKRKDSRLKRISSRIANTVRARILRDATPDTGCGLKLFRREVFLDLPQFDHMHRFLPALFMRAGGIVVSHPVRHRKRQAGVSHYGTLDRLWVGLADLAGVAWLQRRWRRPEIEFSGGQPRGVSADALRPLEITQ